MNWRQEAIAVLADYPLRKQALVSVDLDLERLEMQEKTPRNREGQMNYMVQKRSLEITKRQTALWVQRTEEALGVLTPEERQVLELVYIHPKNGNRELLLKRQGICKTTLYRRRDEALQKFTLSLYGK